jgi:hypothetical protein
VLTAWWHGAQSELIAEGNMGDDRLFVISCALDRYEILAAKATHDRRYGAAIAKLRTAKGLKQSEITGLSERQVRRIEKGEGTTYESLRRLAAAHQMDTSEYLRQVAVTLKDFDSGRIQVSGQSSQGPPRR